MKKIATLAALSAIAFLGACACTQETAAPGAVGTTKSGCCATAKGDCASKCSTGAAPGAVGEKSCGAKADCSTAKVAPGAVSGKSDCSAKSSCASKCPATKG